MRYGTYIFDFGQVIGEFEKYDIVGHFIPAGEDCELLKSVFFARDHWDKLDRGAMTGVPFPMMKLKKYFTAGSPLDCTAALISFMTIG